MQNFTNLFIVIPSELIPGLLILLSIFTLAVILDKIYVLYFKIHPMSSDVESKLLFSIESGREGEILKLCQENRDPVATLIARNLGTNKNKSLTFGMPFQSELRQLTQSLNLRIGLLGTISTAAPLLGLLGTVTGMIKSFYALNHASEAINKHLLLGGIDEALITTGLGLFISIPALVAYNNFVNRVNEILDRAQLFATHITEIENKSYNQKLLYDNSTESKT